MLTYCHDIIENIKCMVVASLDVDLEALTRRVFGESIC
jgi:hypothetical protein